MNRDGQLSKDTGLFDDIEFSIDFNFMVDPDLINESMRKFRKVFFKAQHLLISDDPYFFYRVKEVSIGALSRAGLYKGAFTVVFRCDGYKYHISGSRVMKDPKEYTYNPFDVCYPIYVLIGSGFHTLTVNGNSITVDVPGKIFIDTELELAYTDNNESAMTRVSGDYKPLSLLPGSNSIACSCSLAVYTNWRCI
ncbi:hypothetical protein [Dubosiella newyorkensis]|nr:hypothetical protein [Dubosiella newyorkensis]